MLAGLVTTALGAGLGWSRGAAACPIPTDRRLAYDMLVSGIRVADMELRFQCAGSFALVEMQITSRGVAAFFGGRNRTSMNALVGFDVEGQPQPTRFRASYQKPDRLRETELEFAPDGSLSHLATRNQGRPQESPVPEALREPSIDPLATLMSLSDWLANDPAPGDTVVHPVFEGRKRADLEAVYRGPATVEVAGRRRDAHRLEASLKGISGFDADDNFVTLPGEPRDWIDVYASTDAVPVPLLMTNTSSRLPSRIELTSG